MTGLAFRARRAFRKLQWELLRGGPGRPERLLTVPTENGLLTFRNSDAFNAKGLFVQRQWEMDLIRRTMARLEEHGWTRRPGADVIIDAGANIGMICIAMLRHGYFHEAIAFEPFPGNFELLCRNAEQNAMGARVRSFPFALSDVNGDAEFELSEINAGDHRVRAAAPRAAARMEEESRRTLRVPVRTLDSVLEAEAQVDPARVGLIWVDVQGHEGQLLRGASRTIGARVPVLTEFWPYGILRAGLDPGSYVGILRQLFEAFLILDPEPEASGAEAVSSILRLFESHDQPGEHLELLLLPRRPH